MIQNKNKNLNNIFIVSITITLCLVVKCTSQVMPIGFTIQRIADPSTTLDEYLGKFGIFQNISGQQNSGYNIISLDGFTTNSNIQNNLSPLSIYTKSFQYLQGYKQSVIGNTNQKIKEYIKTKLNQKGIKLLMNVNLKNAPISQGKNSPESIAINIVNTINSVINQQYIDGISIQFEDYHAVQENSASEWLEKLLTRVRIDFQKKNFLIVLIIPPTFVNKIRLFKTFLINSLVDYFVLKYYNTNHNAYNSYEQIFEKSQHYQNSAVFQIMVNEEIKIDICKTIVAKPVIPSGSWNPSQYLSQSLLKNAFASAFARGWFGGYANLEFEVDLNQRNVKAILQDLRQSCKAQQNCIC